MENVDLLGQLLSALQWPGVILAFAGLCLAVVRAVTGPGHTRWTILAGFPLVYFTLVAWHGATSSDIVLPMANPLMSRVPGLERMEVTSNIQAFRGEPPYYLVAEMYFRDRASFDAAMACNRCSPSGVVGSANRKQCDGASPRLQKATHVRTCVERGASSRRRRRRSPTWRPRLRAW